VTARFWPTFRWSRRICTKAVCFTTRALRGIFECYEQRCSCRIKNLGQGRTGNLLPPRMSDGAHGVMRPNNQPVRAQFILSFLAEFLLAAGGQSTILSRIIHSNPGMSGDPAPGARTIMRSAGFIFSAHGA